MEAFFVSFSESCLGCTNMKPHFMQFPCFAIFCHFLEVSCQEIYDCLLFKFLVTHRFALWKFFAVLNFLFGSNIHCCHCQVVVLTLCITVFAGSVLALGAIVSAKPLEDLRYKGWTGEQNNFSSPYASSAYLGWAMASAVALAVTGVLPIISWFATYRFSASSAVCVGIFSGTFSLFSYSLLLAHQLNLCCMFLNKQLFHSFANMLFYLIFFCC